MTWIFILFLPNTLSAQVDWTEAERAWIKANPVLVFTVDDQSPPMNYRGDDGEMHGLSIDYAQLLSERIGVRIHYEGTDFASAIAKALQHTVDGMLNLTITDFRAEYLSFTRGYYSIPNAFVTLKNEPQIFGPLDLSDRRVGIQTGTLRLDTIQDWAPQAEVVEVPDLQKGAELILGGEIDVLVDESSVIQNLLDNLLEPQLKINTLVSFPTLDSVHIGLRNNDPIMREVFDKAIATLSQEDHERLRSKYFPDYNPQSTLVALELSPEEKLWIENNPALQVGVDSNFPPFEFIGAEGQLEGLNIEYLKTIMNRLGLEAVLNSDQAWTEYKSLLTTGRIDLISGMVRTENRAKTFAFSEPFFTMPIVIFANSSSPYVGSLDELHGGLVGVIQGYATSELIAENNPNLQLVYMEDMAQGFVSLKNMEIDVLICNLITGGYYLRNNGLTDIKVVGKTNYDLGLSFAVRKEQATLLSLLNKGLASLSLGDRERIYNNWIGLEYEARTDYGLLIIILVGSGLVIMAFFFWTRSMQREIHRRKRTEVLLTQTNAELEATLTQLEETQSQLIQSEKMSSMGVLVSGIAHELNNPLNYIASGVGAMEEVIDQLTSADTQGPTEEDWETLKALCQNIQIGVERSRDIVAGLKDYSRLDSGIVTKVNMNHCIDLALTMISYEIDASIRIKKEYSELPSIDGQSGKLNQVMVNLLKNSVDSIKERGEGGKNTITIRTSVGIVKEKEYIFIEIQDQGKGISQENRSRIFDPFYTNKTVGQGTGLGLSVSLSIVQEHQGEILVLPSEEGALFQVILPTRSR
jgi:ABC-type amino acid transport substrate-binding protein/nitrogen-specific signal transduction histidine kinase